MADKCYIGDIGTEIVVDCGCDITGATDTKLMVKKPDDSEVIWTAAISGTNYLTYTIVDGDFSVAGSYSLQSALVLGGWSGRGETVRFNVYAFHG